MVIKWDVTIPELTGDETRKAYLYLPESYDREPHKRYPVLYMFDGHNVFFDSDATYGKCWGMKEYMDATGTELLIAAVECNHSPDNGRLKEYSPFPFNDPKFGRFPGWGRKTMEWMSRIFKSDIDRHFRTIPDREHTFIAGSSMGGLMSLYAVLEFNRIYSRAAALSPSLWVGPGASGASDPEDFPKAWDRGLHGLWCKGAGQPHQHGTAVWPDILIADGSGRFGKQPHCAGRDPL